MSNPISRHKILIAEDEEHIAKLVSFKLTKDGYDVTIARNGQEAINQLLAQPWSLFIFDVMMPVCDGWTALKKVRETPQTARIPVVMLTAKGHQKDISNASELGATKLIKKPFEPNALSAAVKQVIAESGGGQ